MKVEVTYVIESVSEDEIKKIELVIPADSDWSAWTVLDASLKKCEKL